MRCEGTATMRCRSHVLRHRPPVAWYYYRQCSSSWRAACRKHLFADSNYLENHLRIAHIFSTASKNFWVLGMQRTTTSCEGTWRHRSGILRLQYANGNCKSDARNSHNIEAFHCCTAYAMWLHRRPTASRESGGARCSAKSLTRCIVVLRGRDI